MYEGLADRLRLELLDLAPPGTEIKVMAGADRKFAGWKGASTFASLTTYSSCVITKEDYEEHGSGIVHRRCC